MGCFYSKVHSTQPKKVLDTSDASSVNWKMLLSYEKAVEKYSADGTLVKHTDSGYVELRAIIDEPLAQKAIVRFAKEVKAMELIMAWIDMQEYKTIPTNDYRRSKALHIYHKYIKEGAVLQVGGISPADGISIKELIDRSKDQPEFLMAEFFSGIQLKCFDQIYHNIYKPFKATTAFTSMMKELQMKYNRVRVEDFDYFTKLGQGGFGLVVHCRKRSTRQHYAMKIQTKVGLLDAFIDDKTRVDFEKQAFASCQHPFIVPLDYSFQTDSLAIMVLALGTAGDLNKSLAESPTGTLSEDRVKFYAAEIILALGYLHQLGLIYRDLKPGNVLLNSDGHIQLVDLGGVVDEKGDLLGKKLKNALPLFSRQYEQHTVATLSSIDETQETIAAVDGEEKKLDRKRKLSIMGTFGYMAPEMVVMLTQKYYEQQGYSNSVDWWSLGVTMYKLLTGKRPFTDENVESFLDMVSTKKYVTFENNLEYAILFQDIQFPENISVECQSFIRSLLSPVVTNRLGSSSTGLKDIKSHAYFSDYDWNLLELKLITPPYMPVAPVLPDVPVYTSFNSMMSLLDKQSWLDDTPDSNEAFATWDFIASRTMRIECGIANEMSQYDTSIKARRIMG